MYFITANNSETGKRFQVIADKIDAIYIQQKALQEELGFEKFRKGYFSAYGGFSSLIFKEKPNVNIYKEVNSNEWMPRLNTKIGKEIQSKLDSCDMILIHELNECIGFDGAPFCRIGFDRNNSLYFGFNLSNDWDVKIPDDCKEVTFSEYTELFNR